MVIKLLSMYLLYVVYMVFFIVNFVSNLVLLLLFEFTCRGFHLFCLLDGRRNMHKGFIHFSLLTCSFSKYMNFKALLISSSKEELDLIKEICIVASGWTPLVKALTMIDSPVPSTFILSLLNLFMKF